MEKIPNKMLLKQCILNKNIELVFSGHTDVITINMSY